MIIAIIISIILVAVAAFLIGRASKTYANLPDVIDGRRPQVKDDINIDLFFALVLILAAAVLLIVSGGIFVLWGALE